MDRNDFAILRLSYALGAKTKRNAYDTLREDPWHRDLTFTLKPLQKKQIYSLSRYEGRDQSLEGSLKNFMLNSHMWRWNINDNGGVVTWRHMGGGDNIREMHFHHMHLDDCFDLVMN
jgi:hypothetical protein